MKKIIAILASGGGTNAEAIIQYFKDSEEITVGLIVSNRSDAFVLKRAENHNIKSLVINRAEFYQSTELLEILKAENIELVVLAGFLWLIPEYLIESYPNKIVNIHPALLPKYGGKGMYGARVHEAVKEAGDVETGITIHLVNKRYDEGKILFQASCSVYPEDTPDSIAQKIHKLEYQYYPKIIESVLKNN